MKLTENQLVTVLLLIETATVSESELKLAWELHDLIQKHRSETPMNSPTCDKCDCVAGCQANPEACPNLTLPPVKLSTVCFGTPEQRMAMLEKSLPKYDTRRFSNLSNQAHGFAKPADDTGDFKRMDFGVTDAFVPIALSAGPSGELAQWFQGPLPDIGDECSYVCIGRTPTSVSMAWVTRQHLDSLKATK